MTQCADGTLGYTSSEHYGRSEPLPIARLIEMAAAFGPVRPVVPPHPSEAELIRVALYDAGDRAVTTLAWALGRCASASGLASMVAGRSGSWEARSLVAFAQWGLRVEPERAHPQAANMILRQLLRWLDDEQRYVELAATLAELFAEVANRRMDEWLGLFRQYAVIETAEMYAAVWCAVADRRLWPDTYEGATVGAEWYGYLMGTATAFSMEWYGQWSER
jgi:hypothetical protein